MSSSWVICVFLGKYSLGKLSAKQQHQLPRRYFVRSRPWRRRSSILLFSLATFVITCGTRQGCWSSVASKDLERTYFSVLLASLCFVCVECAICENFGSYALLYLCPSLVVLANAVGDLLVSLFFLFLHPLLHLSSPFSVLVKAHFDSLLFLLFLFEFVDVWLKDKWANTTMPLQYGMPLQAGCVPCDGLHYISWMRWCTDR